jgi:MerC mercury resistance protein
MKLKINADLLGIGASIACAVHCAILPVFLSGLSIFGVNIMHNFWFESGMILFAFAVGMLSLRHGFFHHHNRTVPFLLFSVGMLFLLAKQFWHNYELILLPFALILIILAHIFNFRYIRKYAGKGEQSVQIPHFTQGP